MMATASLLTPPGTGAIGVIRVTGDGAAALIQGVFQAKNPPFQWSNLGLRLCYGWIVEDGQRIDDVILSNATWGAQPAFDVCTHGGVRISERILGLFERMGAPLSNVQETVQCFWPTASVLDLDCTAALTAAKTERAVRFFAWQRRHLPEALRHVAHLCEDRPDSAATKLRAMIDRYSPARVLLDGAVVAILGPANVGKSTLFNALVGRNAAVVSDRAGTTRDWVSESIEIDGIPLTLIDTAGAHAEAGHLERQAIDGAARISDKAAVRLFVFDVTCVPDDLPRSEPGAGVPQHSVVVVNKLDLQPEWCAPAPQKGTDPGWRLSGISAKTGAGLVGLSRAVTSCLGFDAWEDGHPALFTESQVVTAREALAALENDPHETAQIIMKGLLESVQRAA